MQFNKATGKYEFQTGDIVVRSGSRVQPKLRGEVVSIGEGGRYVNVRFDGMPGLECYRNENGGLRYLRSGMRHGIGTPTISLA